MSYGSLEKKKTFFAQELRFAFLGVILTLSEMCLPKDVYEFHVPIKMANHIMFFSGYQICGISAKRSLNDNVQL